MTHASLPEHLEISKNPDIATLQAHVAAMVDHFGWTSNAERKFLLLTEEIGELAKAVRRMENISVEHGKETDAATAKAQLEDELADVLNYLLDIANGFDVDVGAAYRNKMAANLKRNWK